MSLKQAAAPTARSRSHPLDEITIEAQPRTALGKKVRALRRTGATPIHVYGRDMEPVSLQADTHDVVHALNEVGFTTPLTVKVNGDSHFVIVREIQRHPVSALLLHVDFMAVSRTERREASVPLHFEGEPPAAREEGAMLAEDLHELLLEALPTDMPAALTVDVGVLADADSVIHAGDITLPPGVTLVTEPDALVARIVFRRVVEEEPEAAVLEGEGPAEGEEAAEGAEGTPAEDAPSEDA